MPDDPALWTIFRCNYCDDDRACGLNDVHFDCSHDECHHPLSLADAERIVACVNFCREFPTSALEGRHLKYIHAKDDIQWDHGGGTPDGFVACTLLPVVKDALK
jgi:hypothetical protein